MPDRTSTDASLSTLLVLSTGLALGLSSLPLPLWALAWVALVPLLVLWDRATSMGWFLAEAYTAFLIANAVGFFWPLLHVYVKSPWIVFGNQLLMPLLWALPLTAALPFRWKYGRTAGLVMLAVFHLAIELALTEGPLNFPWPALGHTQAMATPLIQFAEISGVAGLTLWVLTLNGLLFSLYQARRPRRRMMLAGSACALVLLSLCYGVWRRAALAEPENHVTVGLIQPAMDSQTWTNRFGTTRITRLLNLSDSLIAAMNAPPLLIVWPEMALPASGSATRQQRIDRLLQSWTERHDVGLLTGALAPADNREIPNLFYNRASLYLPYRSPQHYDQVHLLPYSDGLSLARHAPWFGSRRQASFVAGASGAPLDLEAFRSGVLLGYELVLGEYARRHVRAKADFLVALSYDGWWGRTPGFRPHLNYLRVRAIETRRSVVQVAASGSTALVSPDGSVLYQSAHEHPDAHLTAVLLQSGETPYVRFGNWLGWTALAASLVFGGWMFGSRSLQRYRRRRWER